MTFHKGCDGGKKIPPSFPYSCTVLVDGIARNARLAVEGPIPVQGLPFDASLEFLFGFSARIAQGSTLRLHEGYQEVAIAVVVPDSECMLESEPSQTAKPDCGT